MTGDRHAVLLTPATNYAVVHLPGRRFPGVVVQGDSLHLLRCDIAEVRRLAERHQDRELDGGIADVLERLEDIERMYVRVCREHGISLPFPNPIQDSPEAPPTTD